MDHIIRRVQTVWDGNKPTKYLNTYKVIDLGFDTEDILIESKELA